jgi:hypothetical protein
MLVANLQSTAEWDAIAQHLVRNGWNVLVPNYRGSTGYGIEFESLSKLTIKLVTSGQSLICVDSAWAADGEDRRHRSQLRCVGRDAVSR